MTLDMYIPFSSYQSDVAYLFLLFRSQWRITTSERLEVSDRGRMDYSRIRARNTKLVDSIRSQSKRASISLNHALYSKQGALASHRYQLKEVGREQKRLEAQLVEIRRQGGTTGGRLPPRMTHNDRNSSAKTSETGSSTNEKSAPELPSIGRAPGSRESGVRASIADVNMTAAKERVTQRLVGMKDAPQERRKSCNDHEEQDRMTIRTPMHNHDGSLRTVHLMPDFKTAYREAKKARYVRTYPGKQWFEKELSIGDIFDKNLKEKTLLMYSPFD
ncbi:hypothetical protein CAPTEDRAFT_194047 [Capitella teleta]|uniref:Uncharacterized protein n=1 Tax=Capitella teleta TaxID=283909 RepID=R7V450_CAPTE|nr:hypothetical protein CAPTEDRAFT_194047 [Capitella teleta]|eukprot:ELU10580.1 hypothetical protein CAPTEDRAFT_194047 [Capitella teleta]